MNGNGELTETENVMFLRKLRSSYGILTDERNSYVLCYGNGYGHGNGYGTLETRRQAIGLAELSINQLAGCYSHGLCTDLISSCLREQNLGLLHYTTLGPQWE